MLSFMMIVIVKIKIDVLLLYAYKNHASNRVFTYVNKQVEIYIKIAIAYEIK